MKKIFLIFAVTVIFHSLAFAQTPKLSQDFLFDDSDIIIKAPEEATDSKPSFSAKDNAAAIDAARNLLKQKPLELRATSFPKIKKSSVSLKDTSNLAEAPFGLLWEATPADTRNQGVSLIKAELKDYPNSYLAQNLPKPLAFFDKVYVVFGKEDSLFRILAYSHFIDDDSSASKALKEYTLYSELLNKKYGNKQQFFSPATITKTIKDPNGRDKEITETAPIGNPDFLSQLEQGTATLYSTYNNKNVAAALSINVDGSKKSYIVIDYKNLQALEKQQAKTLDAL